MSDGSGLLLWLGICFGIVVLGIGVGRLIFPPRSGCWLITYPPPGNGQVGKEQWFEGEDAWERAAIAGEVLVDSPGWKGWHYRIVEDRRY